MNVCLYGDCRESMKQLIAEGVKVQMCVCSPPYWGLRSYLDSNNPDKPLELGLERTPEEYVSNMVEVFRLVRELLKDDGTLWLNLGDSYAGSWGNSGHRPELDGTPSVQREKNCEYLSRGGWDERRERPASSYKHETIKPKDLCGIPWRIAFALQQPHLICKGCGNVAHQSSWGAWPNGRLICPSCNLSKGHEISIQGWYLRQDIIWHKPNPMPESVTDRCTKAHEYIFLLSKSCRYYYDAAAIAEPLTESSILRLSEPNLINQIGSYTPSKQNGTMKAVHKTACTPGQTPHTKALKRINGEKDLEYSTRNKRSVWSITTIPYKEAHFATFPPDLIIPCIKAGSKEGDIVLDPFFGSGTTGEVCIRLGRKYIGCELNEKYQPLIQKRVAQEGLF